VCVCVCRQEKNKKIKQTTICPQVKCREHILGQLRARRSVAGLQGGQSVDNPAGVGEFRGAVGEGGFGGHVGGIVGGMGAGGVVGGMGGGGGPCWVLMENQLALPHEGGGAEQGGHRGHRGQAVKSSWRVKGVFSTRDDAVAHGRLVWRAFYGQDRCVCVVCVCVCVCVCVYVCVCIHVIFWGGGVHGSRDDAVEHGREVWCVLLRRRYVCACVCVRVYIYIYIFRNVACALRPDRHIYAHRHTHTHTHMIHTHT
jgi:hypothetical protein